MNDYILNWNQKRILKQVAFLKRQSFYLAGGTALALQLGHRTSKDLDFYTPDHFKPTILFKNFRKTFAKEIEEVSQAEDTAYLTVKGTELSFFRYPYKLIRPVVKYASVNLASLEDIAAMKLDAVRTRGVRRDFVDIYFLIQKHGLKKILKFTKEKYPDIFNAQNFLDGLMYFADADAPQKDRKRIYLYENIDWRGIKKGIEAKVKKYQLDLIRK